MTDDELSDVLRLLERGAVNAENFAELTDDPVQAAIYDGQASGLRQAARIIRQR